MHTQRLEKCSLTLLTRPLLRFSDFKVLRYALVALGLFWAMSSLAPQSAQAGGRVGLGLGVGMGTGFSVSYDHPGVLARTWSLGGEFYGTTSDTLLGGARLLYWQNPGALSGFFGGPKLFVALGGTTGVGLGGEGGWLYRFGTRIDLGASLDLIFAHSFYGGIKLNVGYLL